jgi:DNA-binding response OmpR family regulator
VCRLQGHDVLEAANGAQAIELGTGGRPDLVLVDCVTIGAVSGLGYRLSVQSG